MPQHSAVDSRPTVLLIRELPRSERPRERLVMLGASALSSAELLALLIGAGGARGSALQLGQLLLAGAGGSLRRMAMQPVASLTATSGVGMARAVTVHAALELGRRLAAETREDGAPMRSPRDVARLFALIRRLAAKGIAIVYISHFLEEVRQIADRYTVLRDGKSVASGAIADATNDDLIEKVTDVNNGDALGREPANEREESFDVGALEAAGGFVHEHYSRVRREGATDLHNLTRGQRELAQLAIGMDFGMGQFAEQLSRSRARSLNVDHTVARLLAAEQHVVHYGEVRAEGEFLMNECHAKLSGVVRIGRRVWRAIEAHLAAIRAHRTGENAHEGALPCSVFTNERVDLTGLHGDVHAIKRYGGSVALGNVGDGERGVVNHRADISRSVATRCPSWLAYRRFPV